MRWIWGLAAVAAFGLVFAGSRWVDAGILAYHAVCAAGIIRHRKEIRPLLAWKPGLGLWALGTSAVMVAGLFAPALFWDPRSVRDEAVRVLFPVEDRVRAFAVMAAYTMLIHASLEEIFWRGVFTDPGKATLKASMAGNFVAFYAVHAIALGLSLKGTGLLLALPTGLAGAAWAWVTHRTKSLWPALASHWAADAAILWGMWHYFLRGSVS